MASRSPSALYVSIANGYREKILDGTLRPNQPIPSQVELAKVHNTSLVTIQKALGILVSEGLIKRIRRKGTFVAGPTNLSNHHMYNSASAHIQSIYFVYEESITSQLMSLFALDFHQRMLASMQEACSERSVEFRILTVAEALQQGSPQGAAYVVYGMWEAPKEYTEEAITRWSKCKAPFMVVYSFYPHLRVPHVNFDNFSGGYVATQHLLDLGHRRIGIALAGGSNSNSPDPEYSLRLEGYRLALTNSQIPFNQDLVFWNPTEDFPNDERKGIVAFRQFMKQPEPPTAVFATTDFMAYGILKEARRIGLKVPEDLSIVGYDDYSFTQLTVPPLTTIRQDTSLLGRLAIERLLSPPNSTAGNLILPELVVRKSTAPPR